MTLKDFPVTQLTSLAIENIDVNTVTPLEGQGGLYLSSMSTAQSRKAFPKLGNENSKSNGMLFYNTTGKYVSTVVDDHFVEVVTKPENGGFVLKVVNTLAACQAFELVASNRVIGTVYVAHIGDGNVDTRLRMYNGGANGGWTTITNNNNAVL